MAQGSLSSRSKHSRQPPGAGNALAGPSVLLGHNPWCVGPGHPLRGFAAVTPWPGCSEPPGSWHPQPARRRAPVPGPACVRGIAGAAGRGLCSTGEAFPGATGSRAQAAPSAVLFGRGSCFFEHEIRNLERILQPQGGFWVLAGLRQSWGLVLRVLPPSLAHFPSSTCWLFARCPLQRHPTKERCRGLCACHMQAGCP